MSTIYRDGISFEKWMKAVDEILIKKTGLTSSDLPDFLWADEWEDRATPRDAVECFLDNSGSIDLLY